MNIKVYYEYPEYDYENIFETRWGQQISIKGMKRVDGLLIAVLNRPIAGTKNLSETVGVVQVKDRFETIKMHDLKIHLSNQE